MSRSGQYQQAEFAADLHQVWRGEAEDEYGKPEEFFRRTFLTEGLRDLLLNAARRLRGEGGDPVVQLQTNFGGGKTHSLIALYHLAGGYAPATLPGVEEMLADAERRRAARGATGGAGGADDRPGLAAAEARRDDGAHAVGRACLAARRRRGLRARRERRRGADEPGRAADHAARALLAVSDPDRRVGRLRAAAVRARRSCRRARSTRR